MQYLEQEPLKQHCTFRIGGPARYYAVPENAEQIREGIVFAEGKGLPWMVIGRGSNILFSDEGYPGVILEIGRGMEKIRISENGRVSAEAGVGLSVLAMTAAKEGLSGLEFAAGIPGNVGGAVAMNAGAYGGEVGDSIIHVTAMDVEGNLLELGREELEMGYRSSVIQREGLLVLEAEFALQPGDTKEILEKIRELNARRREKQPLEFPSAGSTFKRPEGYFAGKLVQDAGLRGYRVGDAQVSEKHCGFVINRGKATAAEVRQVIADVQRNVKEQFGVELEPEVKIVTK